MRLIAKERMASALISGLLATLISTSAGAFTPAKSPLNLGGQVDPNVLFILDDSGSMKLGFMPESLKYEWGTLSNSVCPTPTVNYLGGTKRVCPEAGRFFMMSSKVNTNYFDPDKTYLPPAKGDGTTFDNANFNAAWIDGYSGGDTVDLRSGYYAGMTESNSISGTNVYTQPFVIRSGSNGRAFYYKYVPNQSAGCPATGTPSRSDSCYVRVTLPTGTTQADIEARQNFANWFSYYRTRLAVAQAGSSEAFSKAGSNIRLGWGTINQGSNNVDGSNFSTVSRGVRAFQGGQRSDFFNWLHTMPISIYTPLRKALNDAGQYYSWAGEAGPWSTTPGSSGGELLSCRQSYTILMTDGYWTGGDSYQASTSAARLNVDNTAGPTVTGPDGQSFRFDAVSPFKDSHSNTLADVAMYYWKRDLLPDLANRVPTTPDNPAFWQHMVTYGVSLGVTGTQDPDAAFAAIGTGATINWTNPTASDEAKLDDLLHAAVNSRGMFFAAQDIDEFSTALSSSLTNIASRVGTNTSVIPNSRRLDGESLVYEAVYDSSNWSGKLTARRPIQTSTGVTFQDRWEAGALLGQGTRSLYTSPSAGAGKGASLAWTNTTLQPFFDNSQPLFNYITGTRTGEEPAGSYRRRGSLLGDIVNASIVVASKQDWGFQQRVPTSEGGDDYRDYVAGKAGTNKSTVFVGSNNGFLHAFNAETGVERFAYMPHGVLNKVKNLASPNYSHDYFVDGKMQLRDVYFGGGWKTVLVGGLGAGGKTMFALNVTNPDPAPANRAAFASNVLWEIKDDADLGFTYSEPAIGRLRNGRWVAMFGNGYGSTSNNSVLFIVDIETGAVTKVRAGTAQTGGLSSPAFVYGRDANGHIYIQDIYAGDMSGNLWKFRETSNNNNGSTIQTAFGTGNNASPLYVARNAAGQVQPITVRPEVAPHPDGQTNGNVIYFGTGSFATAADNTNRDIQSVYGIWDRSGIANNDNNVPFTGRTQLSGRSILFEGLSGERPVRALDVPTGGTLDWGPNMRGWYLDLVSPTHGAQGERVIFSPSILLNRLVFSTAIPNDDLCSAGGSGWTLAVDLATGGRLQDVLFDLNKDGVFDQKDMVNVGTDGSPIFVPPSGIGSLDSIPTKAFDQFSGDKYFLCTGTTADSCIPTANSLNIIQGRQSWNQKIQ